jgi:hypothetical protein
MNHIYVRRDYQYKTVNYKNKKDILVPNDDVNNGGFLENYKLVIDPITIYN